MPIRTGPLLLLLQPPTAARTHAIVQHVRADDGVFDIREFQSVISRSPHKAPLSQTAILTMISNSKTSNYDRSVQPVLHIKASKGGGGDQYEYTPLKWAGMVSQTLFQSDTSIFMFSLWSVFTGSRGLDRFFPFLIFFFFFKKGNSL